MEGINKEDVIQILELISNKNFSEFHFEIGDLKLIVKNSGKPKSIEELRFFPPETEIPKAANIPPLATPQDTATGTVPSSSGYAPPIDSINHLKEERLMPIKAPMLGIFYVTPKPGSPPFVKVGDFVKKDDPVCIIEVMKVFNTVKAGVQGRISKICAENAQMVEFKQTLFLVEEIADKGEPPQE